MPPTFSHTPNRLRLRTRRCRRSYSTSTVDVKLVVKGYVDGLAAKLASAAGCKSTLKLTKHLHNRSPAPPAGRKARTQHASACVDRYPTYIRAPGRSVFSRYARKGRIEGTGGPRRLCGLRLTKCALSTSRMSTRASAACMSAGPRPGSYALPILPASAGKGHHPSRWQTISSERHARATRDGSRRDSDERGTPGSLRPRSNVPRRYMLAAMTPHTFSRQHHDHAGGRRRPPVGAESDRSAGREHHVHDSYQVTRQLAYGVVSAETRARAGEDAASWTLGAAGRQTGPSFRPCGQRRAARVEGDARRPVPEPGKGAPPCNAGCSHSGMPS